MRFIVGFVIGWFSGWFALGLYCMLTVSSDETRVEEHREDDVGEIERIREINRHYWQGYEHGIEAGMAKPGATLANNVRRLDTQTDD